MEQNYKVSAIITTYGRDELILSQAIDSVLIQSYQNIEIIIIDDNENESEYSAVIKNYCKKNPGIIYIKQNGNKGACAARNLGIANSSGEFIAFLDDDDTWERDKILKQVNRISDGVGLVFCKGNQIDLNYKPSRILKYYNSNEFKEKLSFEEMIVKDYVGSTSQVIIPKKVLIECGGFDENLQARQDYEMWLRISKKYSIVGVDDTLFNHFIHEGEQISKNDKKSLQGYLVIFKKYKKDFNKSRIASENITVRILRHSKNCNSYSIYLKYLIKYMFKYPTSFFSRLINKL